MNIFIFCSFSTTLIELSDKSNIYGPFFLYVIHELPTSRETHFFLLWKPIKTWLGNNLKEFGISYQDKQSQPGPKKYSDHIKILIWSHWYFSWIKLRAHFDRIETSWWFYAGIYEYFMSKIPAHFLFSDAHVHLFKHYAYFNTFID